MDKLIKIGEKVISIFLIVILIFSNNVLNVRADIPVGQIVVGHNGTWSGLPFTFTSNGKYYTLQDTSGIQGSTYLSPNYFYTTDNEKFYTVDGLKVFTYTLNNIIGVIYKPSELNTIFNGFLTAINGTDTDNNKYVRNGVYDSNDNFIGFALNDISGCYYAGSNANNDTVKDDGNYSNNVKNYLDYSGDLNSFDFFTYYPLSTDYITRNLTTSLSTSNLSYFNDKLQDFDFCYGYYNNITGNKGFQYGNYSNSISNKFNISTTPIEYLVAQLTTDANITLFNKLGKYIYNNELLATDILTSANSNYAAYVKCLGYYNDSIATGYLTVDPYNETMQSSNGQMPIYIGSNGLNTYNPFNKNSITVYRNAEIKNNLDTQIYQPDSYTTTNYKNYYHYNFYNLL